MDLWVEINFLQSMVEMARKCLFSQRLEGGPWDRGWDHVGVSTDQAVHWTDLGAQYYCVAMTPGFSAESYYSHAGGDKMKKEKELERKGAGDEWDESLGAGGYIVLTLRAPCLFSMYVSKLYTPTQVDSIYFSSWDPSISFSASLGSNHALLNIYSSC